MPIGKKKPQIFFGKTNNTLIKNLNYIFLLLMIVSYSSILSIVSINNLNRFFYPAFDIGIFDQGIYLLYQGKDPFVTVRGLHLFGDHIQFIAVFLAPLFWIWDDVRILLIAQSIALGIGALPIYLIAKEKLKNKWFSLIFSLSYLLNPALHYLNLENFHLVSFAVPILLFAFYFLIKKNYRMFFVFVSLALITRQELALTVMAMGIYTLFKQDKRVGIFTILLSLIWLIIIFKIIFPYYIPCEHPNIKRGGDIIGRVKEMIFNPKEILSLASDENKKYIFDLFSPVAFMSFLSPSTLFLASPAIAINLITTWPYAHSIQYHYTYAIIPFIFVSSIYAFSNIKKVLSRKNFRPYEKSFYILLLIFMASALLANYYISPESTSIRSDSFIEIVKNFNKFNEWEKARYEALSLIPKNSTVSATYLFVPHLSHREIIYMFPNPFKETYWGCEFGNYTPPPPTKDVDFIILDDTPNHFEEENIIKPLIEEGKYITIFEWNKIRVLKRSNPLS